MDDERSLRLRIRNRRPLPESRPRADPAPEQDTRPHTEPRAEFCWSIFSIVGLVKLMRVRDVNRAAAGADTTEDAGRTAS